MNEETIEAETIQGEAPEPPEVPFLFGLALWIPTFAVVLYVMMRLFGGRAARPVAEDD